MIKNKRVSINEKIVTDNGKHVKRNEDLIMVDHDPVVYKKHVYIMMNKKQGYISATKDDHEKTVVDLLPNELKHFNPFPVGRLDKNTEGLLLLTNDGDLAHQLTSPVKDIHKTYLAKVEGIVTHEDRLMFEKGVTLDDGYVTKPAILKINYSDTVSEIELTISEGK